MKNKKDQYQLARRSAAHGGGKLTMATHPARTKQKVYAALLQKQTTDKKITLPKAALSTVAQSAKAGNKASALIKHTKS